MWMQPKGAQPTKQDYEELLRRIEKLEQKLEQMSKRGRPKKEDTQNG